MSTGPVQEPALRPDANQEFIIIQEVKIAIYTFLSTSLDFIWTERNNELKIDQQLSLVHAKTYLDEDCVETFLIKLKGGLLFEAQFVDKFRPHLIEIVNNFIILSNDVLRGSDFKEQYLFPEDISALLELTWSPIIRDYYWDGPRGQQFGALAMYRSSGNRKILPFAHGLLPLVSLETDSLDEPLASSCIPSIFEDKSVNSWKIVAANNHWRFGIDDAYDPTYSAFCWRDEEIYSVDDLVKLLGTDLISPRTQRQLRRAFEWSANYESSEEFESHSFSATYVIRGTDVHLWFYFSDSYIIRESYALTAEHPFFETHKKLNCYNEMLLNEEMLDRQYGAEKRAIYDTAISESIDKAEAIEKASRYDPEYDEDSAYGTDFSDLQHSSHSFATGPVWEVAQPPDTPGYSRQVPDANKRLRSDDGDIYTQKQLIRDKYPSDDSISSASSEYDEESTYEIAHDTNNLMSIVDHVDGPVREQSCLADASGDSPEAVPEWSEAAGRECE